MGALLRISNVIDSFSALIGKIGDYLVMLCCLISAGNALVRYTLHYSSNAWLEIQWYLFAYVVMLGASYTLCKNEHIRVDLFYGSVSDRARLWIDVIGFTLFLLPITIVCAMLCWPYFELSYRLGEMSENAGGLIRWPVKLMIFLGFVLLTAQGFSELIKRIAALTGHMKIDTSYEKPAQ